MPPGTTGSLRYRGRAMLGRWVDAATGRVRPDAAVAVSPAQPLAYAPWEVLAAKILFSHARNRQQLLGPPPTAFGQLDSTQMELLAAATIVAAMAGGRPSDTATRRLRGTLSSAGLLGDTPGAMEAVMDHPPPVEEMLRHVRDPHVASLFYAASLLGADHHDPTGQAWLQYLANRLRLPPATLERLHAQYGMA